MMAALTPERRHELKTKGGHTSRMSLLTRKRLSEQGVNRIAILGPEYRAEMGRRWSAGMTPEQRSELAHKNWRTAVENGRHMGAGKGGRRSDLDNLYVRSRPEANVARIFNLLMVRGEVTAWRYEPGWFEIDGHDYLPDFLVLYSDGRHEWWEVKGYWWPDARIKVIEFCRRFPEEHLIVPDYASLTQQFKDLIPEWE
jgi:hypothetical protein